MPLKNKTMKEIDKIRMEIYDILYDESIDSEEQLVKIKSMIFESPQISNGEKWTNLLSKSYEAGYKTGIQETEDKIRTELEIVKTYFELALSRSDPYPAIKDGLNRLQQILKK
jgi:hypothetical protein